MSLLVCVCNLDHWAQPLVLPDPDGAQPQHLCLQTNKNSCHMGPSSSATTHTSAACLEQTDGSSVICLSTAWRQHAEPCRIALCYARAWLHGKLDSGRFFALSLRCQDFPFITTQGPGTATLSFFRGSMYSNLYRSCCTASFCGCRGRACVSPVPQPDPAAVLCLSQPLSAPHVLAAG